MLPVPSPQYAAYDAACCAALGAVIGAARALLPAKGRAAFVPDVLEVGALLLLLQSYAAGLSASGALRWYMPAGGFAAALAVQAVLARPLRAVLRLLAKIAAVPLRFAAQKALCPLLCCRRERALRAKALRDEKRSAKKHKKALQKHGRVLYNSNA